MVTSNESTPVSSTSDKGVSPGSRWASALQPMEEFEHFIDRFFRRSGIHPLDWMHPLSRELQDFVESRMPRLDVVDSDDNILVRAEVPGVAKEVLDLSISENLLTIQGTLGSGSPAETTDQFYRTEISRGRFTRSVSLPAKVDGERATANLKDGILEIVLPKLENSKRTAIPVE